MRSIMAPALPKESPAKNRRLAVPLHSIGELSDRPESEDCLVLNVWTRGLRDGGKRPVMFWIHGGGFTAGSGSSPGYDGTNLAKRGDVVVVTINHRLNVMGFSYLAGLGGAEFANTANVGMMDYRSGAALGPRQHRELRRRSESRDDLRRIGRWSQSGYLARDARCQRLVPCGGQPERADHQGRVSRRMRPR